MTAEQNCIVWLSSIHQIGPKKYRDLLSYYGSTRAVFDHADAGEIARWQGWGEKTAALVAAARTPERLESVCHKLETMDVALYFQGESGYPPLLNEIYDPPPVLYARGALSPALDKCVAMVGTRHCTRYGRHAAHTLASALSQNGCTVVSGLARGIDTSAHLGALDAGGFTVAVLGCGPDVVYPSENENVYRRILESGCVISEYYPGTGPSPGNFPARNRIISGMSHAVAVVESREQGGSMITVRTAQEQGRDVFSVPGNIDSPASRGTNRLIAEGAPPLTEAEDLLFAMGWQAPLPKKQEAEPERPPMSGAENSVYEALWQGALHYDALCQTTALEQSELAACLTLMEIRGIIKQLPGRVYALSR